jgi:ATP-dependent Zn protease
MGSNNVLPYSSNKSKENIDNQIFELLEKADKKANFVLSECKQLIDELAESLIENKKLDRDSVEMKIYRKNPEIFKLEF